MAGDGPLWCPSHRCVSGASLIGIRDADGRITFLGTPLKIDADFVRVARRGSPPETRFRFASPCAEGLCANWEGGRCGVVARVARDRPERPVALPDCAIRDRCRWHAERGEVACHVCPDVVRGAEPG